MTEPAILLVDHDCDYLRFFQALAEKQGIRARYAANAEEAWGILSIPGCELMIIDPDLPDGNGTTLAEMAVKLNPAMEIVVISDRAPASSPAADSTVLPSAVAKPSSVEEVVDIISSCFGNASRPCRAVS